MWLETLSQPADHAEKCPTCGGCVQRRSYGEMHAGSFVLDGQRVEIRKRPADGFADPIVLDPLTQYFDGGLYRLWPSEKYLSRGGAKLHRDVWIGAFGPVPKRCHIHHRDNDPFNNSLSNLECQDGSEHLSYTLAARHAENPIPISDATRDAAAEWHRSDAGRLWHRRHMARVKTWTKWYREDRSCEFCGKVVAMVVRKSGCTQRFCHSNCKAAHYRQRKIAARSL